MMQTSASRRTNVALDQRHRHNQLGDAGFHDLPRAPRNPRATSVDIAERIVEAKMADPLPDSEQRGDQVGWGAVVPQRVVGRGDCWARSA